MAAASFGLVIFNGVLVSVVMAVILLNSISSTAPNAVQMLRFEKGLENVLFLVYR